MLEASRFCTAGNWVSTLDSIHGAQLCSQSVLYSEKIPEVHPLTPGRNLC